MRGLLLGDEMVLELDRSHVNAPNTTKLFTFKLLILCYVNFTSFKRKKRKRKKQGDIEN